MPITADTPRNILIGAGEIYRDEVAGGATMDDNVFRVEQDRFVPELNGAKWDLIGLDYIQKERAFLEFTSAETDPTTFPVLVPGSSAATVGNVTTVDSDDTRRIPTTDYHDYRLSVPGLDGLVVDLFVDNAIQTENAEFTAGDAAVAAPRVTARASGDPADLTASPWRATYTAAASS